jgi:hypothetical protein
MIIVPAIAIGKRQNRVFSGCTIIGGLFGVRRFSAALFSFFAGRLSMQKEKRKRRKSAALQISHPSVPCDSFGVVRDS